MASEADAQGAYRLLTSVFEPRVADLARGLLEGYPGLKRSQYLIVEDPAAPALQAGPGLDKDEPATAVVSTLCLAPMGWSLQGVRIPVAGLELVATDPRYRGRGLLTALSRKFDELAAADGYLLAGVLGIPHFYGRFGYVFASQFDESASLPVALVLKAIDADPFRSRDRSLVIRHWEEADLPAVAALWDEQDRALDLCPTRTPALWDYWFRHDFWVGVGRWHVVTEGGRIVGCFALPAHEQRYIVYYLAALERDVILEIYRFAASTALENGQPQVLLRLPADGPAHAVALSVGGRSERSYGWQVKVYDRARLLRALAPVLERRLAASPFRNLSGRLVLDLYSSRLFLAWTDGRLASVTEEPSDGASVPRARLPVEAFTQLVLGYRSVSDLLRDSQNVQVSRAVGGLLEVLFPPLKAWVEL